MAFLAAIKPDNLPARDLREVFQRGKTGRKQRESPHKGRRPVGDLEGDEGHLEGAGDQRDYCAHRSEKTPDKNRPDSPAFEECLAPFDHVRIAREWPNTMGRVFELQAD